MENSAAITASLPGRYASALYDLAAERGVVDVVTGELAALGTALATTPEFARLIRNPRLGREGAARLVEAVCGAIDASPLTRDFMGVLAENRRLAVLADIITAFGAISAAARGQVTAHVTSAHPLSAAQVKALAARLKARDGRDVTVEAHVDAGLLGGLVVRIGSREIDSSIRTRLNSLAQAIRG